MIAAADALLRVDRVANRIQEIEVPGQAARTGIKIIIGLRIVGIVRLAESLAIKVGTRIGQIPAADLAFDGQRGLDPLVAAGFRTEALDLEIANSRIEGIGALAQQLLVSNGVTVQLSSRSTLSAARAPKVSVSL
jgi:hypothetical protein